MMLKAKTEESDLRQGTVKEWHLIYNSSERRKPAEPASFWMQLSPEIEYSDSSVVNSVPALCWPNKNALHSVH